MRIILPMVIVGLLSACDDHYGVTDIAPGYYKEAKIVSHSPKLIVEVSGYHLNAMKHGFYVKKDDRRRIESIEVLENGVTKERIFFFYTSCNYKLIVFYLSAAGNVVTVAVEKSGGDKYYDLSGAVTYRGLNDIILNNFYYDEKEECYIER